LLFQNKEVRHIPNGVDVNIFKPSAQMEARAFFGLPMDRPIVLFGAVSMNDPRKGLRFLDEALQSLRASGVMGSILLVRFGSIFKENLNVGATVVDIGNIREQEKLALLYAAADIFVASSLEDNLPNTLLESLACGTPVVGFRIGGFPEIIDHNINGYLAEPRNSEDLASGIAKTFATVKSDSEMRKQSRKKIEEKFSLKRQAEAYSKLYQELLDQQ
jgi:glycosyltransferase involved in cell wall biosynthesis